MDDKSKLARLDAVMVLLLLTLCGCSRSIGAAANMDAAVASVGAPLDIGYQPVSAATAFVHLPPGAGEPATVHQRTYSNGVSQEIALTPAAASGSSVEIAIQSGPPLDPRNKAPVWKPGAAGVHDELRQKFPAMPMQVVATPNENQYGPLGLAIGRAGNLRCIYAWQYIDDARSTFKGGQYIEMGGALEAPAALRIKLCRSDMSLDDLASLAKQVTVEIPRDYAAVATTGDYPVSIRPHRSMRHRRPRQKASVVDAGPPAAPPVTGYPPAASAYPPAYDGRRFMAPVTGPSGGSGDYSDAPAPMLDLPPRAYVGPGYSSNK